MREREERAGEERAHERERDRSAEELSSVRARLCCLSSGAVEWQPGGRLAAVAASFRSSSCVTVAVTRNLSVPPVGVRTRSGIDDIASRILCENRKQKKFHQRSPPKQAVHHDAVHDVAETRSLIAAACAGERGAARALVSRAHSRAHTLGQAATLPARRGRPPRSEQAAPTRPSHGGCAQCGGALCSARGEGDGAVQVYECGQKVRRQDPRPRDERAH